MPAGLEHGGPLSFFTLQSERAAPSRALKEEMSECRVSGEEQHPQGRLCKLLQRWEHAWHVSGKAKRPV